MSRKSLVVVAIVMALALNTMGPALGSSGAEEPAEAAVSSTPRATDDLIEQHLAAPGLDMAPTRAADVFEVQPGVTVQYLGNNSDRRRSVVGSIYADVNTGTDLVAQTLEDATRQLLVLHGANAPEVHRFRVDADMPIELRMSEEGGVHVIARNIRDEIPAEIDLSGVDFGALAPHEVELAYIAKPWAEDAAGNDVATKFELRGRTVVQTIEHRGRDVSYPIVADPRYSCGAVTCTTWFNRNETRLIAEYGWIGVGICGKIPWPGSWVCMTYVGLHWRTADRHYQAGGCLYQRFQYLFPQFQWSGGHYGWRCD